MNKVLVEITKDGWKTEVSLNGKTFTEKHVKTATGATCIAGDFDSESELPPDLWEAVTGFYQYDIMKALNELS